MLEIYSYLTAPRCASRPGSNGRFSGGTRVPASTPLPRIRFETQRPVGLKGRGRRRPPLLLRLGVAGPLSPRRPHGRRRRRGCRSLRRPAHAKGPSTAVRGTSRVRSPECPEVDSVRVPSRRRPSESSLSPHRPVVPGRPLPRPPQRDRVQPRDHAEQPPALGPGRCRLPQLRPHVLLLRS